MVKIVLSKDHLWIFSFHAKYSWGFFSWPRLLISFLGVIVCLKSENVFHILWIHQCHSVNSLLHEIILIIYLKSFLLTFIYNPCKEWKFLQIRKKRISYSHPLAFWSHFVSTSAIRTTTEPLIFSAFYFSSVLRYCASVRRKGLCYL